MLRTSTKGLRTWGPSPLPHPLQGDLSSTIFPVHQAHDIIFLAPSHPKTPPTVPPSHFATSPSRRALPISNQRRDLTSQVLFQILDYLPFSPSRWPPGTILGHCGTLLPTLPPLKPHSHLLLPRTLIISSIFLLPMKLMLLRKDLSRTKTWLSSINTAISVVLSYSHTPR